MTEARNCSLNHLDTTKLRALAFLSGLRIFAKVVRGSSRKASNEACPSKTISRNDSSLSSRNPLKEAGKPWEV